MIPTRTRAIIRGSLKRSFIERNSAISSASPFEVPLGLTKETEACSITASAAEPNQPEWRTREAV